jgi:hypothetical protein
MTSLVSWAARTAATSALVLAASRSASTSVSWSGESENDRGVFGDKVMTADHTFAGQASQGQTVLLKRKSCVYWDEVDAPCCPLKRGQRLIHNTLEIGLEFMDGISSV